MPFFKGKFRSLKTRLSPSRPQSPEPSVKEGAQGPSRSPTPSPSTLGRKSDTATIFTLAPAEASESTLPGTKVSFVPDPKAEPDDDLPTISIDEGPASPAITVLSAGPSKHRQQASAHVHLAIHTPQVPEPAPVKRRFVQSGRSQHDLVVLHVAYVVRDSTDLQDLVLELVRISDELDFKEVVKPAISMTVDLVAALDTEPIAEGTREAISQFLGAMKTVDLNESPDKALRIVLRSISEIKRDHPALALAYQKHSSRFSTISSKVLGITLPFMEILKDASSMIPIPMMQPLVGIVAGFMKAASEASNNFEWMRWLAATAAEYIVRIAAICPREIEGRWTKAIEGLDGKLSRIVQDASDYSQRSVISRFLSHGIDSGDIMRVKDDLRAAIDLFNMEVQINIKIDLDTMSRNIESLLLENLPRLPSHKISHDRYFRASREKEIRETLEWIEAENSDRFLWFHGAAGVGKSTYARRLLDHIKEEGMLGAFAYFAIGIDSDPKDLVRMMARELASLHPGCRHDVVRAIKECSGTHQGLREYIEHYLVRPISTLAYSGPLVIILDALDEWAFREEFLEALVRQVRLPATTALKFVMTSRYSTGIDNIVSGNVRIWELTPVTEEVCRDYFEDRFQTITWHGHDPDRDQFDRLIELADGLLIWAATVCTLVSVKRPNKRPHQILDDILSSSATVARGKKMEELYRLAMSRIFPDEDEECKQSRSNILLAMAALKETLPLAEFALLVDVLPEFVNDICIGLRALQTRGAFDESLVQPAIKIFHASFIDYFGTLQEARTVMAHHCISFFDRSQDAEAPEDIGVHLFRQAELYIGKHFADHIAEAPADLQSQTVAQITSDHLRLWAGWSLAHLMLIGEDNGCPANSYALQTMAESLLDAGGVIYSPELMTRNNGHISDMIAAYRKMLTLAGLDSEDYFAGTGKFILEHNGSDVQRWAHVINSVTIGSLQLQQMAEFNADRPTFLSLELALRRLEEITKAFDGESPLSILENLALALEIRFKYSGAVADLERAITLHTSARQSVSNTATVTVLNNLANALHTRFQYVGSHMDDLDRSISLQREAFAHDDSNHHKRATVLDSLGVALHTKYVLQREGSLMEIDEVVDLHQRAFKLHEKQSSHLPILLNNLSSALQSKFEQEKEVRVLDTAFFYALQAASTESLGNLEKSTYTATLAHALHLVSVARSDPCSNVPEEHLHLTKTAKFGEIYSFEHPSHRYLDYAAIARDLYREASNALPLASPSRWTILNLLGLAQQARATMDDELDLRYADEAIFLHHMIKHRQHESHPMRILSDKYLQRAFDTLLKYNIPLPDPDVTPEKKKEEEVQAEDDDDDEDESIPLYTSEGRHCEAATSQKLYRTRFLHHLRHYVRDSEEPVILYRFSSEALEDIWRPCGEGDADSDGDSDIEGVDEKDKPEEALPVLWNLMCTAKYLAIWGLPEKVLSQGPTRLRGLTYHKLVTCFEERKPSKFEHQFIYAKETEGSALNQVIPGEPVPAETTGDNLLFTQNPLQFAVVVYLASQYERIPSLRDLAGLISSYRNLAAKETEQLAQALVEIVPMLFLKRDETVNLLSSCVSTSEQVIVKADDPVPFLTSIIPAIRDGLDNLKTSIYPQDGSSPSKPSFADLVLDVGRFLQYPEPVEFDSIFCGVQTLANLHLVQPLLDILQEICDRYFRSTIRKEEEIHFVMLVVVAQLSSGIAYVCSDGRHPVDGRLHHAINQLSGSMKHLLSHTQDVDELAGQFREIVLAFRRQAYDRSQLARTFVLCMACHSVRLWDRGWANRWYYATTIEKLESTYDAESDFESNDEDDMAAGAKMRMKIKRNLRLGARRKLKTALPVQLKPKKVKKAQPSDSEDSDSDNEALVIEEEPSSEKDKDGKAEHEEPPSEPASPITPVGVTMPIPEPFKHDNNALDGS